MTPYDWTRITPDTPMAPVRQRPEPTRWLVSLPVAMIVGALAFGVTLVTYLIALTVLGLIDVVPSGVGAAVSLLFGVAAAMFTWRGIRARWHRMPVGGEDRWS